MHDTLHPVTLVDLLLGIVQPLPKHLDLLAIVRANRLNFHLHGLFEILLFLLLTEGQVRLDPALPQLAHPVALVRGKPVLNHLS